VREKLPDPTGASERGVDTTLAPRLRAIRLGAINAFGLRPHELDQATQGTPAKSTACIAENEEESPWPTLHTEFGLAAADSAVTAMVVRSGVHIEARHTMVPEQLATDLAGTIA
jgi:hypothetical protein